LIKNTPPKQIILHNKAALIIASISAADNHPYHLIIFRPPEYPQTTFGSPDLPAAYISFWQKLRPDSQRFSIIIVKQ